jgi:hypothetical protein
LPLEQTVAANRNDGGAADIGTPDAARERAGTAVLRKRG